MPLDPARPETIRAAARTLRPARRQPSRLRDAGRAASRSPPPRGRWRPTPRRADTFTENGVAVKGHDPVAYFTQARPVPRLVRSSPPEPRRGHLPLRQRRQPRRLRRRPLRATPRNMAATAPGRSSQGYKAPIIPEAWAVVGGKLYLNASRGVQRRWQSDVPGFIAKADRERGPPLQVAATSRGRRPTARAAPPPPNGASTANWSIGTTRSTR